MSAAAPQPPPLCAGALASAYPSLLLSLLPSHLLAEVDRLIAINTWRVPGVALALTKINLPQLARRFRRLMLESGEELLVNYGARYEDSTIVLEPGTSSARLAMITGSIETFVPAKPGSHGDLLLTRVAYDRWQLHSVATALMGGAPLLDRSFKSRVLGIGDGYHTWPMSTSGEWLQAGAEFYRFPLLEYRVDEPAALSRVPYDECTVFGSPEKERFWLITIFWSGIWQTSTLAAYDMRTGAKLYDIVTDTTYLAGDVEWFLWPELALVARDCDVEHRLFSLTDGTAVQRAVEITTSPSVVPLRPLVWRVAHGRFSSRLLGIEESGHLHLSALPTGCTAHTSVHGERVLVATGDCNVPPPAVSLPAGVKSFAFHSDALFTLKLLSSSNKRTLSVVYLNHPGSEHLMCALPDGPESGDAVCLPAEGPGFLHGPMVRVGSALLSVRRPPVPAALSVLRRASLK